MRSSDRLRDRLTWGALDRIPWWARWVHPTLHWCGSFDDLAIDRHCEEWEHCSCEWREAWNSGRRARAWDALFALAALLFLLACVLRCWGCAALVLVQPAAPTPVVLGTPQPGWRAVIHADVLVEREGKLLAAQRSRIAQDIEQAEVLYQKLNIEVDWQFHTIPADVRVSDTSLRELARARGREVLTIFYVFPFRVGNMGLGGSMNQGISAWPWEEFRDGIVIFGCVASPDCLAHELGHWLGLLHTFEQDDLVADTQWAPQSSTQNIMDYSNENRSVVTQGQLDRMWGFLCTEPRCRAVTWLENK